MALTAAAAAAVAWPINRAIDPEQSNNNDLRSAARVRCPVNRRARARHGHDRVNLAGPDRQVLALKHLDGEPGLGG